MLMLSKIQQNAELEQKKVILNSLRHVCIIAVILLC